MRVYCIPKKCINICAVECAIVIVSSYSPPVFTDAVTCRHAHELREARAQLEQYKELLATYEQSIGRKDHVIANLTKALQKQVSRTTYCTYMSPSPIWLVGLLYVHHTHTHTHARTRYTICHAFQYIPLSFQLFAAVTLHIIQFNYHTVIYCTVCNVHTCV